MVGRLKMLGLYLDNRIIGHKFRNSLSKLNELTLQKELHNFVTNNVFIFLQKKEKAQQQKTQSITKVVARAGNRTRDLSFPFGYLCTTESTESINCCQATDVLYLTISTMGRIVNKQSQIIFSVIF